MGHIDTQSAHIGYKARLWKVVTDGGKTEREAVNKSTYKMVPKIYTVGVATADPNLKAAMLQAIATQDIGQVNAVIGAASSGEPVAAPEPPHEENAPQPEEYTETSEDNGEE